MPKMRTPDLSLKTPDPAAIPTTPTASNKVLPSASATSKPMFFKTAQLAERWELSEHQVHRYVASGALIATRFGRSVRIRAVEVTRFEAERFGVS